MSRNFCAETEHTSYEMFGIGINSWKIIKPNGVILEKTKYYALETEFGQQRIEIGAFKFYRIFK